jgi:hypothetical protein
MLLRDRMQQDITIGFAPDFLTGDGQLLISPVEGFPR